MKEQKIYEVSITTTQVRKWKVTADDAGKALDRTWELDPDETHNKDEVVNIKKIGTHLNYLDNFDLGTQPDPADNPNLHQCDTCKSWLSASKVVCYGMHSLCESCVRAWQKSGR
jgi:hypothetical protein